MTAFNNGQIILIEKSDIVNTPRTNQISLFNLSGKLFGKDGFGNVFEYVTGESIVSISGNLQNQIDNINSITLVAGDNISIIENPTNTFTISGSGGSNGNLNLYTLLTTTLDISGNLQEQINNISLTPGPQGIPGISGEQGIQGIQGIRGIQGIQGIPGISGEQGIQGIQGIPGISGEQGIQGIQGIPGISGEQGIQGIPGISGNSIDSSLYTLLITTLDISGNLQEQINAIVQESTSIASSGGSILVSQNGTTFNLEVDSSLISNHNNLLGLQGGNSGSLLYYEVVGIPDPYSSYNGSYYEAEKAYGLGNEFGGFDYTIGGTRNVYRKVGDTNKVIVFMDGNGFGDTRWGISIQSGSIFSGTNPLAFSWGRYDLTPPLDAILYPSEATVTLVEAINSEYYHLTSTQYASISGGIDLSGYTPLSTTSSISGNLQEQINNISLTPGPQGVQGISGAQGIQGIQGVPGISGNSIDSSLYTLLTITSSISGNLQEQINNISLTPGPQGIPGISGAQGIQGIQGVPGISGGSSSIPIIVTDIGTIFNPDGLADIYDYTLTSSGILNAPTDLINGKSTIFMFTQPISGAASLQFSDTNGTGLTWNVPNGVLSLSSDYGSAVDIITTIKIGNNIYVSAIKNLKPFI